MKLILDESPSLLNEISSDMRKELPDFDLIKSMLFPNKLSVFVKPEFIKKNIKIAVQTIKNFFGNVYTKNFMALPLYIKYYGARYSRISNKLKSIINGEEK